MTPQPITQGDAMDVPWTHRIVSREDIPANKSPNGVDRALDMVAELNKEQASAFAFKTVNEARDFQKRVSERARKRKMHVATRRDGLKGNTLYIWTTPPPAEAISRPRLSSANATSRAQAESEYTNAQEASVKTIGAKKALSPPPRKYVPRGKPWFELDASQRAYARQYKALHPGEPIIYRGIAIDSETVPPPAPLPDLSKPVAQIDGAR